MPLNIETVCEDGTRISVVKQLYESKMEPLESYTDIPIVVPKQEVNKVYDRYPTTRTNDNSRNKINVQPLFEQSNNRKSSRQLNA